METYQFVIFLATVIILTTVSLVAQWKNASRIKNLSERVQMLQDQALKDHLTNAFNRAYCEEELIRQLNEQKRHGKPFTFIICDVDHMKHINDTYGHLAGDEILRSVVKMIWRNIRSVDVLCRWGGEEFAIILPETNASGGWDVAERIRTAIADMAIKYKGRIIRSTISLGVFTCKKNGEITPENITEWADAALYKAKNIRNATVVWRQEK